MKWYKKLLLWFPFQTKRLLVRRAADIIGEALGARVFVQYGVGPSISDPMNLMSGWIAVRGKRKAAWIGLDQGHEPCQFGYSPGSGKSEMITF